MGDYNIDLLKYDTHRLTAEFVDLMFANSFVPTINRPTRVTETSGTVIDNIFTNCYDINSKTVQGILTTDISDHYAVFHVNNRIKSSVDKDQSMIIRIMNEKKYKININ